jgi:predicted ribonuclease YlaK
MSARSDVATLCLRQIHVKRDSVNHNGQKTHRAVIDDSREGRGDQPTDRDILSTGNANRPITIVLIACVAAVTPNARARDIAQERARRMASLQTASSGTIRASRFSSATAEKKVIDFQNKVWNILARNIHRNLVRELMTDETIDIVSIQSEAGHGKSFLALAVAFFLVLEKKAFEKIYVAKPMVEIGQKIGYLNSCSPRAQERQVSRPDHRSGDQIRFMIRYPGPGVIRLLDIAF